MSLDDDESSLQLAKLISSEDTTVSSVDKTDPDPDPDPNPEGQRLSSSFPEDLRDAIDDADTSTGSKKPLPDLNECYGWLLQNVSHGKHFESASSSRSSVSSSSSSSSSSFLSLPMPTPPDGGWGWMVVVGAFLVSFICDGVAYCFGVLYAELLSQFGESKSKTSLVGSLFFGVSMILGPLASSLTTRFGCRKMTIFGGLLSTTGFILSYFANSIEMLCLTFSVIVGIGFSFCYVTAVVIVAFYFKKRRALATGLAVCGTGVGTFTFGPLMDGLISEYGWRGLFLIMAGFSLNLVVCGMLFRPLKFSESERCHLLLEEFEKIPHGRKDLELKRMRNQSESTESSSGSDLDSSEEEMRTLSMMSLPTFAKSKVPDTSSGLLMEALKNSRNPHLTMQRYMKNAMFRLISSDNNGKDQDKIHNLTGNTYTTSSYNPDLDSTTNLSSISCRLTQSDLKKDSEMTLDDVSFTPLNSGSSANNTPKLKRHRVHAPGNKTSAKKTPETNEAHVLVEANSKSTSHPTKMSSFNVGGRWAYGIHLPLYRTDIFYRRSLKQNAQTRPCMLGTSCPELIESCDTKPEGNVCRRAARKFCQEVSDLFSDMIDFSLFTNGFFTLFILSNFLYYFWSDVPYMYATDHAMNHGSSPRDASFLISVIGIFNTLGQVVFGFVGDMNINLISLYAILSVLAGIFVAIVPFVISVYWQACIFYSLFGFCASISYPLTPVLMVNYLGMEKLTSAYGLLMLVQGIANLLGPPFAGWVSDETSTYNSSFYLSGLFYALSGLVMFMIYIPACKSEKVLDVEDSQQHSDFHDEQETAKLQNIQSV